MPAFRGDGGLVAHRINDGVVGERIVLRADYVAESVELAYASTTHAAQGRTVDVAVAVVDPALADRASLYVGITRGRTSNRVYVIEPEGSEATAVVDVLGGVVERDPRRVAATELKAREDDAAVSLARLGPAWAEAMARLTRSECEADVARVLEKAHLTQSIAADPAAPAFWEAVAAVKANGYDPAEVLASTLAGREVLATAKSPAQVLHYRLTTMRHLAWAPTQREVAVITGTYLERSPAPSSLVADLPTADEQLATYARHLAGVMDARVISLGERAAVEAPSWAIKHLGEVPGVGTSEREQWCARAGAVVAYREQYVEGGAVDVADPIGHAPSKLRQPLRHGDWVRAAEALQLDRDAVRDVATADDADLRGVIEQWNAAIAVAPPYVKALLDAANREHRRLATHYEREMAVTKTPGRHLVAQGTKVAAAAERAKELLGAQAERDSWYVDTAELREAAQEARAELSRRGADPEAVVDVREEMNEVQSKRYDTRLVQKHQADVPTIRLTF